MRAHAETSSDLDSAAIPSVFRSDSVSRIRRTFDRKSDRFFAGLAAIVLERSHKNDATQVQDER